METVFLALALVLVAGFINGSFAAPMKYMTRWEEENVWFAFSFFGFLILPWLSLIMICPQAVAVISAMPLGTLLVIAAGGIAFGLGQIAFARAFQYVGIGLAFVINISMGTSGSALIPLLWHEGLMNTAYGYMHLVGIAVFVVAVIFGAAAGAARDRNKKGIAETAENNTKKIKSGMLLLGVFLAFAAGVGSVAQGLTYIWSNPSVSEMARSSFGSAELGASVIVWVLMFSVAWIPYVTYFFIINLRRGTSARLVAKGSAGYWGTTVLMGVGFWGSLIFFSMASNVIGGDLAPTIACPLFMVFIILTSNFWSFKSGEWQGAGFKAKRYITTSLVLFVVAIAVFAYSSTLEPDGEGAEVKQKAHHTFIEHKNIQK